MNRVSIIIPNWNGADLLQECIDSLLLQTYKNLSIIVVENGSIDASTQILNKYEDKITVLPQKVNLGFAGGVNVGIKHAINNGSEYVGLFNNDASADANWAAKLVEVLDYDSKVGIVTSKIVIEGSNRLDSTGDWYTTTGMPFPRGRGEVDNRQYDTLTTVFGASGGASLYRSTLLQQIGLFDEDFFAYYEDVDISFRAQLHGWVVKYQPEAIAHHKLSATSSKLGYFAIRQSAKNFWFLYIKNVPYPLSVKFLPAALYRYARMFAARLIKGGFFAFLSGFLNGLVLFPKKFKERRLIQKSRTVSIEYLEGIIYRGKPPVVKNNESH